MHPTKYVPQISDRTLDRLVRRLGANLEQGDLSAFKAQVHAATSPQLLAAARSQKILTRGDLGIRTDAAGVLVSHANEVLELEQAAEFTRYASLSLEVCAARERLRTAVDAQRRNLLKLSLRQLLYVAERTLTRLVKRAESQFPGHDPNASVSENERRLHDLSGYANDASFAVVRALNETAGAARERNLRRPDAIQRSLTPFLKITLLAGLLNSLDYVLDSASFGDFIVSEFDVKSRTFKLEFADFRGAMIRQLSIRREMVHMMTGLRERRFVREQLRESKDAVLADALGVYLEETGARLPNKEETDRLHTRGEMLLREINAEDDLLYAAAGDMVQTSVLYFMAMSLRLHAFAAEIVESVLPGRAKREFVGEIRLNDLTKGLIQADQRRAALNVWDSLTVEIPARAHFEILRRPFVRTAPGVAQPIRHATLGTWAVVVRETLIKGGKVGQRYGELWESFLARSFEGTGWNVIGRNIKLSDAGKALTEVDLLLLRDDLLLVVEVKALTGSGITPYDHWKNRIIIEKGCRQAGAAAAFLSDHPEVIESISNGRTAKRIKHIQPLVLTNLSFFDGWEYAGVPVAAETIRKAITEGTKVEYYNGTTLEVSKTEHYLRAEELSTETILAALRNPIELRLAPEQGAITHVSVEVGELRFQVPRPAVGPVEAEEPTQNSP